jgi:hypothetical protein
MTEYGFPHPNQEYSDRVREVKAKRQAVLARARAQRAQTYKRTPAELIHAGAIIRGSQLKERYRKK